MIDSQTQFTRSQRTVLALVLLLGAVLTGALTVADVTAVRALERGKFEADVAGQLEIFHTQLAGVAEGLHSVPSLFDASDFVSREEFGRFTAPLLDREPYLQALMWAPLVPAADVDAHIADAIAEGLTTYRIRDIGVDQAVSPAEERELYFPVRYVEPVVGNRTLFGVDWSSHAYLTGVLDAARDIGGIIASAPVEQRRIVLGPTVLVAIPVYHHAHRPTTIEDRRFELEGFVIRVINTRRFGETVQDLLEEALGVPPPAIAITDPFAPEPIVLFDDSDRGRGGVRVVGELDLWGRAWTVTAEPAVDYSDTTTELSIWLVALGGLALTIAAWSLIRGVFLRQQLAEAQASSAEAQYQAIVESTVDGIITIAEDGTVRTMNAAAGQMFDYAPEDVIGQNVSMLMPEPDRLLHDEYLRNYVLTGVPKVIGIGREVIAQRRDGSTFEMDLAVSEMRDASGSRVYSGVVRDISVTRQAARDAAEREARFRNLYEAAPVGIGMLDAEGAILGANPALLAMLGVSSESELAGRRFRDLRHPSYPYRNRDRFAALVSGDETVLEGEAMYRHSSGRPIWVETVTAPVRDEEGNFLYAIRMVQDVTDRHRAEQELREREVRYRSLVQSAPIGITVSDDERRIVEANEALADMLGYRIEELIGKRLSGLEPNRGERLERYNYRALMAGEIDRIELVRELQRKDGPVVIAHTITAAVRDDDGNFLYALRLIQDVTEQIRVDRMKDEFLSVVSHELRTPLTAIHGAVSLAASGVLGGIDDRVRDALSIASNNSSRLGRLIEEILDLERMEAGHIKLTPVLCDAQACAIAARDATTELVQEAGALLELDVEPLAFTADEDRVIQVLTNLVGNALKFSDPGGVVRLKGCSRDDAVCFAVADEGPGIPSDQLDVIFDRFRQVDGSDSRIRGGSGLGLAIVRHIMQQHGGRVWVESKEGEGSTFHVEFPISGPPAPLNAPVGVQQGQ